MKLVVSLIIIISSVAATIPSFSQDERTQEYLRQEEQRRRAATLRQLDSGIYYMDLGEYALADQKFRYVLENVKSVPSDLTFYFGKNSYYMKLYKQSVDWLNKYIQLKGTSGQFHQEAVGILKNSEAELVKEKSQQVQKAGEVLSYKYDIDCGPAGKVTCPVCKGDHVVIKRGAFGDEYKTCQYCNEHGILTCEEYNKLLRGELKPKGK